MMGRRWKFNLVSKLFINFIKSLLSILDENTFSRELWVFEYQNVSVFNNAEVDQLLVKLNGKPSMSEFTPFSFVVSYQSGTIPDDDSSLLLQDRFTESMRNLLTRFANVSLYFF